MTDIYEALDDYLNKLHALRSVTQCTDTWNADRSEPGYLGTRCDLLEGHGPAIDANGQRTGGHRARVPGTSTVVTW